VYAVRVLKQQKKGGSFAYKDLVDHFNKCIKQRVGLTSDQDKEQDKKVEK
jgi:hypothetical protein